MGGHDVHPGRALVLDGATGCRCACLHLGAGSHPSGGCSKSGSAAAMASTSSSTSMVALPSQSATAGGAREWGGSGRGVMDSLWPGLGGPSSTQLPLLGWAAAGLSTAWSNRSEEKEEEGPLGTWESLFSQSAHAGGVACTPPRPPLPHCCCYRISLSGALARFQEGVGRAALALRGVCVCV